MKCGEFDRYLLGEISGEKFEEHMLTCPECRREYEADKIILAYTKSKSSTENASYLWPGVENAILKETKREQYVNIIRRVVSIAAVVLLVLGISWQIKFRYSISNSDFLAESALKRVESLEAKYEQAIDDLEKQALPEMQSMDTDLAFLYKDKLETIDKQIRECKNAMRENPGNGRIRRYLLAALKDKKQTLSEMIKYNNNNI
ncbi:hypothetical protein J7K93_00480 [bacterium]|nr:hypothetical protein [bacterium]